MSSFALGSARKERLGRGVASVHGQGDPGDEASFVTRKVQNCRRDVLGLAEAAQGMALPHGCRQAGSAMKALVMGVSMTPGHTQFTRTFGAT